MIITNYYGRTGAGKSKRMKENIIKQRGRHLLVVPRRKSVDECFRDLLRLKSNHNTVMAIVPFSSPDGKRTKTSITKQIIDCAAKYTGANDHGCLIITQAAFQQIDPEAFTGWHLKLDELLTNGNPSGPMYAPVLWPGLAHMYTIEPLTDDDRRRGIDDSLRRLRAKPGIELKDVFADSRLSKEDQNLFQRAASPIPVYIDAEKIEDVGRRRCQWCSPWTFDHAEGFASVEIAACDIEQSLMHLLSPRPYEMERVISAPSNARICILYFDAGETTCSANYWETARGEANLRLVGAEIARRGGVDYWTCNESAEKTLRPLMTVTSPRRRLEETAVDGCWVRQQQDGTNVYRDCTSCAILISSKAQEHEAIFAKLSPAANLGAITKSREDGLIFQFVSRGAVRLEHYAGNYTIYVFDRQQAEALSAKLISYDYVDVQIEHIAVEGFTERVREPKGRKPVYLTPDEREAASRESARIRQRKHRDKQREAARLSTITVEVEPHQGDRRC